MLISDLLFGGRPKLIMQSKIHYYSPKLIIKKILLLEVQIFILHYIYYLESY